MPLAIDHSTIPVLMRNWEIAILQSIDSEGGRATNQEIYSKLEDGEFMSLTDDDLRETEYGGRPAYQHQVRSHLSNMVESGDLKRVARGTYSITTQGQSRLPN